MNHRVDIDPRPKYRGEKDPVFTAYHEGKEICRSAQPFYDSCRVLLEMGKTGRLDLYGPGLRISGDIEKCARWTISSGNRQKYVPPPEHWRKADV